jgi:hypothetical protein
MLSCSRRSGNPFGKVHPEPLLSPACKKGLPSLALPPQRVAGALPTLSNDATMQICRLVRLWRDRLPYLAPAHSPAPRARPGGRFGKAHPEPPLNSSASRKASRTLHHRKAWGPDSHYTTNTATMRPCRIDRLGSPRSPASRQAQAVSTIFLTLPRPSSSKASAGHSRPPRAAPPISPPLWFPSQHLRQE